MTLTDKERSELIAQMKAKAAYHEARYETAEQVRAELLVRKLQRDE